MKKVAVVVVTYNRKESLMECLSSVMSQTFKNITIFVIDNASTDGTKESLQQMIDQSTIQYYNTGSNLGGAGGFNYGIKVAAKAECDYLWIMDDDTIPEKEALESLIKSSELLQEDFGFLSSYVKYTDGTFCRMNRQLVEESKWINDCELIKYGLLCIKRGSFVSLFVKREIIYSEGLPIKEFYIWGDDAEYTFRLSENYRCFFDINSVVVHKTKENRDTSADDFIYGDNVSIDRYFYNYRNKFYIARTYNGAKGVLKEIYYFISLNFKLLFKCKKCKWKKLGVLWKGYVAGVFFHPSIEYIDE